MIRNIKIHNIHDIIEISKIYELNKCTHQKNKMFPMIFQSSMGLKNQGVMVPNGTTQGNSYPLSVTTQGYFHPKVTFYKHYQKIQTNEQMYMALQMIKQGKDEKVEAYYEHILRLANYLQH
jgi:hypothetical protein